MSQRLGMWLPVLLIEACFFEQLYRGSNEEIGHESFDTPWTLAEALLRYADTAKGSPEIPLIPNPPLPLTPCVPDIVVWPVARPIREQDPASDGEETGVVVAGGTRGEDVTRMTTQLDFAFIRTS